MIDHPALRARQGAGVRLGLERVRGFLSELGDPHLALPVLHVAGTNGKGSVCAMLDAMLGAAGLRVGVTISPHLSRVNERVRLAGELISDEALAALLDELDERAARWGRGALDPEEGPALTWFEFITVAAFVAFSRAELDVAVVEVGLGGRLDATNVVRPEVTTITSVSLDHCDRLGPDLASIAAEKAGVLKPGVPMVVGRLPKEALRVVRSMAASVGSPLEVLGEDFEARGEAEAFTLRAGGATVDELQVGLGGRHQVDNAAVAWRMIDALGARRPSLAVPVEARREGLRRAHNPGRCEWLAADLLVDGAHNVGGAEVLAAFLKARPREARRTLLLGASSDKDIRSVAAALAPEFDRVLTTSCAHPRARSPGEVAEALVGLGVPVMPAGPVEQALPLAREGGGLVVAAGSLFLVGAVRDLLSGA